MKQEKHEAAAAAMVEGELAVSNLAELHGRLRSCFARSEPFVQAQRYVAGLMSDLPRKNGWTLAEYAGDWRPDGMQRLLNHAVWGEQEAMRVIRSFVVEQLGGESLRVASLDESGQAKQGIGTAGAQRQYMGCAGKVDNGVNTVYCSYATSAGHALVGAGVYLPAGQLDDPERRAQLGIDAEIEFQTKPQLARDLLAPMVAEGTMPPWCAGDEVYGRFTELRTFCEDNDIRYVLRVGCAFHAELAPGLRLRTDEALTRFAASNESWQVRSVPGSKGQRRYAWAWIATSSERHFLLIRKHAETDELAYHYCYIPPDRPVTLATLVQVACLRWPVEEDFEHGKDHFGLDQSQVRLHTALTRHIVLTMAALAVCAVTAAQARARADMPKLPTSPDEQPPDNPGLIPLTVPEIKRLFALAASWLHDRTHRLHWHWWRRRHQARARWFHHRTRLQQAEAQP